MGKNYETRPMATGKWLLNWRRKKDIKRKKGRKTEMYLGKLL